MRKVVIYYHTRNLSTIRKIQEHFGFPKKMTVNGEWVVNVKNEQWEELKEYEIRRKPEPPKPKLTKEQIRKLEYEQRLKDYEVQFLFECNGVKVYRFIDGREVIYFTDANGMTRYQYTTRAGLVSNQTHRVQSINTRR